MASQELQQIIKMIRDNMPEEEISIEEQRAGFEAQANLFPVAEDIQCDQLRVEQMPAEWVAAPGAGDDRVVLYLHGGGYVIGSINTHRELASRISRAAGARVLQIEYRLAPEHPYPAAVEDAVTAYRWLISEGVDPARITVAGDSAGGGLTVATLVALKERGEPSPGAAVCLSPWVDMEGIGESMTAKAEDDPIVQKKELLEMAKAYLGDADARTPLAAPLYADLSGLPPMLIQVGTTETLLDDSTRLAGRAREAGVDVTFEPWKDMIHVWHFFAMMLPEGQEAIERIGSFIKQHT
ncbi:MAG: alpha/beta hydrolase [Deltaproteobacteria bacterium]|nr:alpha/beta hydrolase [Deltaproteobacteria bacterium]MBW2050922.1 alpha/beta hydrolase [Deltaproteobacteria bacterium]MBW2141850.1 alpha/beta hydrolase [Deltaproteobacteria bacterium]MBW2323707.1 alpha/beta hydrolase [Deltaproteobacteria bacterium]